MYVCMYIYIYIYKDGVDSQQHVVTDSFSTMIK